MRRIDAEDQNAETAQVHPWDVGRRIVCMAALVAMIAAVGPSSARASAWVDLIRDNVGNGWSSSAQPVAVGDDLVFVTTDQGVWKLWHSDGTAKGTEAAVLAGASSVSALTRVGDRVFFVVKDGLGTYSLWKSEGSAGAAQVVKVIAPAGGLGGSSGAPTGLTALGGRLFFFTSDGAHGSELWSSDGTAAGTAMVRDINPGPPSSVSSGADIIAVDGTLYFVAVADGGDGWALWGSDGTAANTVQLERGYASELVAFDGALHFVGAGRGLERVAGLGTPAVVVPDFRGTSLTTAGRTLFFVRDDDELWKLGVAGPVFVRDMQPGWHGIAFRLRYLTALGDRLFFTAARYIDCGFGCEHDPDDRELWVSDGTFDGTRRVKDINPGVGSSDPNLLKPFQGRLVFSASSGTLETEPWESDGTEGGTRPVGDLNTPTGAANPGQRWLAPAGDTLFILNEVWAGQHRTQLWRASWGDAGGGGPGGATCPGGAVKRIGDVNCDGFVRVAVLGDSYISGEGSATTAFPYRSGTDVKPPFAAHPNLCHRSERSWAVRLGERLTSDAPVEDFAASTNTQRDVVAFLACSGAVSDNVDGVRTSASWGHDDVVQYPTELGVQLDRLERLTPESFDVVLLSIGGNDAGFPEVATTCVLHNCVAMNEWRDAKIGRLDEIGNRIAQIQAQVRELAPDAELYQVNYPDPLRPLPDRCLSLGKGLVIDGRERAWVSQQFLARLNARIAAATRATGTHLIDVSDAFDGHPICGDVPYANGLIGGSDILGPGGYGIIGKESFHPNALGQDRLRHVAQQTIGFASFGSNPNPGGLGATSFSDPNSLSVLVTGPNPDTDVIAASGVATAIIRNGPANTVIVVPQYSLASVGGRGLTDAAGNASIPVRVRADAAPGLHHLEIWTADGRRLGLAPFVIPDQPGCTGDPDGDGDGLTDVCDLTADDGPLADYDGDGLPNGDDDCPLTSDAGQADADADGEGDACDPDAGASLFSTGLVGSPLPPASVPPGAPRDFRARIDGGRLILIWSPPAADGGAAISGYRISSEGTGITKSVAPDQRQAEVPAPAPGDSERYLVAALNANGAGPPSPLEVKMPTVVSDPEPTPTPTPRPGGSSGSTPPPHGSAQTRVFLRVVTKRLKKAIRSGLVVRLRRRGPADRCLLTVEASRAQRRRVGLGRHTPLGRRQVAALATTTRIKLRLTRPARRHLNTRSRLRVTAACIADRHLVASNSVAFRLAR
jgi:ELWxxDGT repeat protein